MLYAMGVSSFCVMSWNTCVCVMSCTCVYCMHVLGHGVLCLCVRVFLLCVSMCALLILIPVVL